MAYVGYSGGSAGGGPVYAGMGNPQTGQQGFTRSQMDPGYAQAPGGGLQPQYMDPQAQMAQAIAGLFGPQQALSNALGQQQVTDIMQGGWFNQEALNNQMQQQQQEAGFQQQGFGLDTQSLGIQQGALARQLGELPQQYGIQQAGFGLQEQQIGLGETAAKQNEALARSQFNDQSAASGNAAGFGANQQRQSMTQNLQNQLANFGINRQQVGLQRQGAAINYAEQTASLQDAQKQLGIQAQRLGLSEQEVTTRLNDALKQLGLQGDMDAAQVAQEISKVQQGMISPLSGMMGFFSQYLPGLLSPGGNG